MSLRDFNEDDQPEEGQGRALLEENEGHGLLRPAGNLRPGLRFGNNDLFTALEYSVLQHRIGLPHHILPRLNDSMTLANLRITELASLYLIPDVGQGMPFDFVAEPEGASRDADQRLPRHLALGHASVPEEVDHRISALNHLEFPELNFPSANHGHALLPHGSPPALGNFGHDSLHIAPPPPSPTGILLDGDRTLPNFSLRLGPPDQPNLRRPRDRANYLRCFIMEQLLPEVLQYDITTLLSQLRHWMHEYPENPGLPLEEDLSTTIGCISYLVSVLESDLFGSDGGGGDDVADEGWNPGRPGSFHRHRDPRGNTRDNSNRRNFSNSNRRNFRNSNRSTRGNRNRGGSRRADCEVHNSHIRVSILIYLRGIVALFFQYVEATYEFSLLLEEWRVMQRPGAVEVLLRPRRRRDNSSSS